jgi:4-diphosphocytidyl-2C-methyl-D-erythritol kinase
VLPAFRLERNRGLGPGTASPKVHAGIENDFQSGVFSLSPDFPRIHQQLCRAGARWASLSGSGAAQFGVFAEAGQAQGAARELQQYYRCWRTRFVSRRECEQTVREQ